MNHLSLSSERKAATKARVYFNNSKERQKSKTSKFNSLIEN